MSNFTKLHLTHEIFRILLVFSQFLWNWTFIFSESHGKFSLVLLQMINYIFSLGKKNVKMNVIFFKFFWYKVFVHWKLFCLNVTVFLFKLPSVYRKITLLKTTILQLFTKCNKMLQQKYVYFQFQHQHYKLTKSLRSSHPKPPAPITKILADSSMNSRTCSRKTKKVTITLT